MVEKNIVDFLELKGDSAGLGFYSEQAMEAVHHDFKVNIFNILRFLNLSISCSGRRSR